ncbi:hypothetical protein COV53_00235, partial [Candidatus Gottesmanbacteria bacterium CG11_big_fil_rev_8_21_14_0_20_37_11]
MLKNISLWIAVSALFSQTTFAQQSCAPQCKPSCPQPPLPTQVCETDPCCPAWETPILNAAYNYSARIDTRNPYNIFFDASFVYWQPIQENMELGIIDTFSASDNLNGKVIDLGAKYKPGFKVGVGRYFDHDDWDWHGEYTWFHCTQHKTKEFSDVSFSANTVIFPMWGSATAARDLSSNVYTSGSENWRLMMDIGEADLGRRFYVGKNLIIRPNVGVRGAWIDQKVKITYVNPPTFILGVTDTNTITCKSKSWSAGLKSGVDADWKLGAGFRFYSSAEADLLFTNYTQVSYRCIHQLPTEVQTANVVIKQK